MGRALLATTVAAICVLAFVLAVIGSFLSPAVWHPLSVPFPVGSAVAVVSNIAIGVLGVRGAGSRLAPTLTALIWLGVALLLGSQRAEGDLIVPGTWPGVVYLFAGTAAAAVPIAMAPRGAARRTSTGRASPA